MKERFLICLSLIFLAGCVQMRDYTGTREGAFGLDIKQGFDSGVQVKDYYIIKDGLAIIVGDTKNEIISKIGLPTKVDLTLDKYENWTYEKLNLSLLFKDDKLNSFRPFQ